MGHHRVSARLSLEGQRGLDFGSADTVELRLDAFDDADAVVELIDAPGARINAGAVVARVDTPFELLFRLTGTRSSRTRVRLAAALGEGEVEPFEFERRFTVEATAPRPVEPEPTTTPAGGDWTPGDWLSALPEGGVRAVFEHIERFGAINETDATGMLGSPRAFRRFSQQFERYADHAPFEVRIDAASGQKRYVREGS